MVSIYFVMWMYLNMTSPTEVSSTPKRYKFTGVIEDDGYLRTFDKWLYITRRDLKKFGLGDYNYGETLTLEVVFKDGKVFKGRSKFFVSQDIAARVKNIADLKIIGD